MRKNRNNRPPEVGARGLLRLRCPCCGKEFGTYLHVSQMSIGCRCGATISLERGLAHYELILTAFFGKSIAGYSLDTLKHFILRSFEIRSDNSSVRSIAEDVDFIQRAVFARSFGNGKQEVPE